MNLKPVNRKRNHTLPKPDNEFGSHAIEESDDLQQKLKGIMEATIKNEQYEAQKILYLTDTNSFWNNKVNQTNKTTSIENNNDEFDVLLKLVKNKTEQKIKNLIDAVETTKTSCSSPVPSKDNVMELLIKQSDNNNDSTININYVKNNRNGEEEEKIKFCQICNESIFGEAAFQAHVCVHTHKKWFKCSQCDKEFRRKVNMLQHMQIHTRQKNKMKVFKCEHCDQKYNRKSSLKLHMMNHPSENLYKCSKCNKEFAAPRPLRLHMATHSTKEFKTFLKSNKNSTSLLFCKWKGCKKIFNHIQGLRYHMNIHENESPFKCSICERNFRGQSNLTRHLRTHTKEKVDLKKNRYPRCTWKNCKKRFFKKDSLTYQRHMQRHNGEKPYKCSSCEKCYLTPTHLKRHFEMAHDETTRILFVCTLENCKEAYTTKAELNNHILTHNNGQPYKCSSCNKCFRKKHHLGAHILRIHDPNRQKYECHQCGASLASRSTIIKHLKAHEQNISLPKTSASNSEKPFVCEICNKKLGSIKALRSHSKEHTETPYECSYCGKKFSSKQLLEMHLKYHERIRPMVFYNIWDSSDQKARDFYCESEKAFKCGGCPKQFKRIVEFNMHRLRHTGETPFECSHCSRKYPTKVSLLKHFKTQHRNKTLDKQVIERAQLKVNELLCNKPSMDKKPEKIRYPCTWENCTKSYKLNKSLKYHLLSHDNKRAHKCSACPLSFNAASGLRAHFKIIHDPQRKTYECHQCGLSFKTRKTIMNHLRWHKKNITTLPRKHYSDSEMKFECEVCNKKFVLFRSLKHHSSLHPENSFECPYCNRIFSAKNVLERHIYIHQRYKLTMPQEMASQPIKKSSSKPKPREKLFCTWRNCNTILSTKSSFRYHMLVHKNEKPYKCALCDKDFRSSYRLLIHSRVHDPRKGYECDQCGGIYFTTMCGLKKHLEAHKNNIKTLPKKYFSESEKKFECEVCNKRFVHFSSLTFHSSKTHTETPFKCSYCVKRFSGQNILDVHLKLHKQNTSLDLESIKCQPIRQSSRGKILPNGKTSLQLRTRTRMSVKSYKCSKCNEKFPREVLLQKHIQTHDKRILNNSISHNTKSYNCNHCAKIFSSKLSLELHIKNRLCVKSYECSKCHIKFPRKWFLQKHMMIHEEEKLENSISQIEQMYNCKQCNKTFNSEISLKSHTNNNKCVNSYECSKCHQKYSGKEVLQEHMKTHMAITNTASEITTIDNSKNVNDKQNDLMQISEIEPENIDNDVTSADKSNYVTILNFEVESSEVPVETLQKIKTEPIIISDTLSDDRRNSQENNYQMTTIHIQDGLINEIKKEQDNTEIKTTDAVQLNINEFVMLGRVGINNEEIRSSTVPYNESYGESICKEEIILFN